jgi:predicted nucleic acid-binding Zn finger protein
MKVIEDINGTFLVQSATRRDTVYTVNLDDRRCSCPAFTFGGGVPCKHIFAVLDFLEGTAQS